MERFKISWNVCHTCALGKPAEYDKKNEFQAVFSEYEANRNLEPGVQGGGGNALRTAKGNTNMAWIIAAVIALSTACVIVVAIVFFKRRSCHKKGAEA